MDDFETIFNNLDSIDKKSINAYRSAREFKNMATQPLVYIDGRYFPTIIASMVNALFSCELFLKALLILRDKKIPRGHSLKKLLNKANLLMDVKKKLINYDFEEELDKIDNSFAEWRYCYEKDTLTANCGFINDFCNVLEEIARKKIFDVYHLDMLESFI